MSFGHPALAPPLLLALESSPDISPVCLAVLQSTVAKTEPISLAPLALVYESATVAVTNTRDRDAFLQFWGLKVHGQAVTG
jgi:hypothetical protein